MPIKKVMPNRRTEQRLLCADMVFVQWTDGNGRQRDVTGLLEDISASGACLQMEAALDIGTSVELRHAKANFSGIVCYCVYREIGYFIGVHFSADSHWSQENFEPQHLLDLRELVDAVARRAERRHGEANHGKPN